MKIYLALAAVLILAVPTAAEPMLLVELHWEDRLQSTNFSEAILGINARLPFTDPIFQANFSGRRSNHHVGQSFSAAPDLVDKIETVFTHPTGHWWIYAAFGNVIQSPDYSVDDVWDMPQLANMERPTDATAITHVARRGFGLTGYSLTDVTQTINRFVAIPAQQGWIIDQAQTIRIYGEPIPEPASWLLACLALCCAGRHRSRPSTGRLPGRAFNLPFLLRWRFRYTAFNPRSLSAGNCPLC